MQTVIWPSTVIHPQVLVQYLSKYESFFRPLELFLD